MERYLNTWQENKGCASLTITTSRGWPYGCDWCRDAVHDAKFRQRSPESVVAEMKLLKEPYQNFFSEGSPFLQHPLLTAEHTARDMIATAQERLAQAGVTIELQTVTAKEFTTKRPFDAGDNMVSEIYTLVAPEGEHTYRLRYRLFSRDELVDLLTEAGFVVTAVYGDYEDHSLNDDSAIIITIGQKPPTTEY